MSLTRILIIALLLAPLAGAAETSVASIESSGKMTQHGEFAGFSMSALDATSGVGKFSIKADAMSAYSFKQTGVAADASACAFIDDVICSEYGQTIDDPRQMDRSDPTRQPYTRWPASGEAHNGNLVAVGFQDWQTVKVTPLHGLGEITSDSDAIVQDAIVDPCVTSDGIVSQSEVEGGCVDEGHYFPRFTRAPLEESVVVTNVTGNGNLNLKGDLMIEVFGLELQDHKSGTMLFSGEATDANGLPVYSMEVTYLRIFVEGGHVQIQHGEGLRHSEWAAYEASSVVEDGLLSVDNEQLIAGDFSYIAKPFGSALAVTYEPTATAAAPVQGSSAATTVSLGLLGLVAVAALGFLLRRRAPSMDQVEDALGAGAFRKAANLSHRIMRKTPTLESARLSHAISLTRMGRPQAAVAALEPFLEDNEPADGTLHYVMGMALLDMGERIEATKAFKQAVARTPALLHEIAPELELTPRAPEGYS